MRYAIQLDPGAVGRDAAARIALTATAVPVEITVTDSTGTPLRGATVTLAGQTQTTDIDGLAAFVVRPGRHDLTVAADGYVGATSTETIA